MEQHEMHSVFKRNHFIQVRELFRLISFFQAERCFRWVFLGIVHDEVTHAKFLYIHSELFLINEEDDPRRRVGWFVCILHVFVLCLSFPSCIV